VTNRIFYYYSTVYRRPMTSQVVDDNTIYNTMIT